ncbi:MAG: aminoglycoside phosphotransferase family protein [Lachnoclostridium sp.]|nr:aminoglycoside phosphotransferase family protein [Lachnoclostridium sp.]
MNKDTNLYHIMGQFDIATKIFPYGSGHINGTYCIDVPRLLLQKINTNVFKNPEHLMENIQNVTEYLKVKILEEGGNPDRETLNVIKTLDGKNYYVDSDGSVYRMYYFINNTKVIEDDKTYYDLYQAGKGFGHFQKMLREYPVDTLHEIIPDFHHTPKRVQALKDAIEADCVNRAQSIKADIDQALRLSELSDLIISGMEKGEIPVRVTHNDTKINNILFDRSSGEAVCVIDLDTVMPGSMLYDFGDALRMGASTGAEDEVDLSKVEFDTEAFRHFAKGYLEEMRDELTEREMELLPESAAILTYECGIRFLTDYLNGDTYFKIKRENHNLDRARNQFKLVEDILQKMDRLKAIISELK